MLAEKKQWKVHFALNSKGGVGKSLVSCLLGQHYQHAGEPCLCFDADATTATLSRFKKLNVRRIELMEGTILNPRQFDTMLEPILTEDAHCIVDTGASSFVAVSHYIMENDVHEQIRAAGKKVVVHVIIVGGATLPETLNDFDALARQLPAPVDLIVWLNEHFAAIKNEDGKGFTEMDIYNASKARIAGIVHLPQRTVATFGEDIKQMMALNLTFEEAIASPAFNLMAKQRLRLVNEDVRKKLSAVL
jgi:CobQ/CobB/MinD/ParA nucleotide binding domain